MKNLKDIKSPYFTTKLPKQSKYKLQEVVRLRELHQVTHPALRRYGVNVVGIVVGMRYQKGNYMRCYPYYVQFHDGEIFPIKPAYLSHVNQYIELARREKSKDSRAVRKIVEDLVRACMKLEPSKSFDKHQLTDKALAKIRKIYENGS